MEKIFDKKNVILIRVDDSDLASFLVDSDINDTGDYEWRIKELAEAVINVVPEYVFANHMCYNIPIVFGFRRRKLWNSQCLEPEVRL